MRKIRVIRGGCGICYTDVHGAKRHALKTPESGVFECSDEQAGRLVRLGVAVYAGAAEKPEQQEDVDMEQVKKQTAGEHIGIEDLENWDYSDLKKLAADMGIEVNGRKKSDYITAIRAAEDDEAPPDLDAADPE